MAGIDPGVRGGGPEGPADRRRRVPGRRPVVVAGAQGDLQDVRRVLQRLPGRVRVLQHGAAHPGGQGSEVPDPRDPGRRRDEREHREVRHAGPAADLAVEQGGPVTAWCTNTCLDTYFNVTGPATS